MLSKWNVPGHSSVLQPPPFAAGEHPPPPHPSDPPDPSLPFSPVHFPLSLPPQLAPKRKNEWRPGSLLLLLLLPNSKQLIPQRYHPESSGECTCNN
ncbi:hypothetical protein F2Q70_00012335 [Brassica cretica]|uniref:Uncharacterized protein n=1 Tax=Brassica cretica TaxID=69181 RepID=A0A8S9M4U3_BRACR|nr:hypothetical protein F2Q70_00012335 [Brassica cretica]